MLACRGMGAIMPSKMPKGDTKARRDDTDFTQYAEGGPAGLYANINAKGRAYFKNKEGANLKPPVSSKQAKKAKDRLRAALQAEMDAIGADRVKADESKPRKRPQPKRVGNEVRNKKD